MSIGHGPKAKAHPESGRLLVSFSPYSALSFKPRGREGGGGPEGVSMSGQNAVLGGCACQRSQADSAVCGLQPVSLLQEHACMRGGAVGSGAVGAIVLERPDIILQTPFGGGHGLDYRRTVKDEEARIMDPNG
ncbi:hypothetical protein CGRA01v4_11997 [Colletotrichum graminicola]|nr:hypothetical protein CGRA01v4_11997 [Colletotrichum graminicola]